ncbi:MAG: hypothetical protein EYC62_06995 [Alphaproteobacteria bacterium]|nr:MAG: hypothetical protein EYC62_06995 [Alphaproteobacteria bacterium]
MNTKAAVIVSDSHNHYGRLIKRTQSATIFWREKLMEVVGNYRVWKKTVAQIEDVNPEYCLLQTRRVKRLVAQAYVEYRRKQSELNLLIELSQQAKASIDIMETNLSLRLRKYETQPLHEIAPSNAA